MKKIYSMFMTVALLVAGVAMTGCKNDNNNPQEPAKEQTYKMSIQASKGTDASANGPRKVLGLDGTTLNATWAAGEKVTVYNETKDATLDGYLEAQSSGASTQLLGELTGTIEAGDRLTLKYLAPNYTGQQGTLTYISANCDYAVAENVEVTSISGETIYTSDEAAFVNQQAIVKFTIKDAADHTTLLSPTELTFSDETSDIATLTSIPAATYTTNGDGVLFVAVPGFSDKTVTLTATVGSDTYTLEKASTTLANGRYYALTVEMTKQVSVPAGMLSGEFSVSATTKVHFSQGNLQYNNGSYQFATNQWDYLNTSSGTTYDLFPWYSSSSDLGKNAITNGGNAANAGWYTLTKDEWDYLRSHGQSAPCQLNGVNGYILAPDDYYGYLAGATYSFDEWTLSASDWTYYESNGCVFLPQGTGYWSVTEYDLDVTKAYKLQIVQDDEWGIYREMTTDDKTNCNSVRLVIDVPF